MVHGMFDVKSETRCLW